MKIGIVIADEYEYIPFRKFALTKNCTDGLFHGRESLAYADGDKTVTAVQCGIGKVNAATAAAFLIAEGCGVILSAGLSGAISGLRRGDMIAAESYVECDFDLSPIGRPLGVKPGQEYVYKADERLLEIALSLPGMKKASGSQALFSCVFAAYTIYLLKKLNITTERASSRAVQPSDPVRETLRAPDRS